MHFKSSLIEFQIFVSFSYNMRVILITLVIKASTFNIRRSFVTIYKNVKFSLPVSGVDRLSNRVKYSSYIGSDLVLGSTYIKFNKICSLPQGIKRQYV